MPYYRHPRKLKQVAGTNPIHNKKPKKQGKVEDEDDIAFKQKQAAGKYSQILGLFNVIQDNYHFRNVNMLDCR